MSTTTSTDTVTIDEPTLKVVRQAVAMHATGSIPVSHDYNDWPAIVEHLENQRRWADLARDLETTEIPVETARRLLPLIKGFLTEDRDQLDVDKEHREKRRAGDTDCGWGGSVDDDLAQYDRNIAVIEESIAASEDYIETLAKASC